MAISVQCDNCQRNYNVSESHAGKKFRCKGCQSVVSVPASAAEPADDDPFGFDMSAMSAGGDGEDGGDWDSGMPAPAKKSSSKKGKKKSTSKTRSRSSSSGAGTGKVVGAVAGGLVTLLVLASVGFRIANRMNGGAGFGLGPSWSSYTTPGGEATFDAPGNVQSQPGGPNASVGSMMYLGESRDFACGVLVEPKPVELQGISEEEALGFMQTGVPLLGGTNVRRTTVAGRPAVAYDIAKGDFNGHCTGIVGLNTIYTFTFLYRDNYDAAAETRFLGSIRVNQ